MQATGKTYNFSDSLSRIDEILNSSDNNYEERKDIPSRSQLTFTNGFYVKSNRQLKTGNYKLK